MEIEAQLQEEEYLHLKTLNTVQSFVEASKQITVDMVQVFVVAVQYHIAPAAELVA